MAATKTSQLSCRFYSEKFPEVDDVVMVNVQDIENVGAYVRLLEYNDIEGMILLSELSRRRIRSINKLLRVGRNECVVVIRVDKAKGENFNTTFLVSVIHPSHIAHVHEIIISLFFLG